MKKSCYMSRSVDDIFNNNVNTTEQNLLYLVFSNLSQDLLDSIINLTPLCKYTWITAQHLISLASLRMYHKSYICLLKFYHMYNSKNDDNHCQYCSCMKFDLNYFNKFGITPFLKSLPCNFEILTTQITMGANIKLSPRCSLFVIINPLFAYMKHLVNQIYDQTIDDIDVGSCLTCLCSFGLDPNHVPPNICSNLMVLFSIAADITIQSDFEDKNMKKKILFYLDQILEILLRAGMNPTMRNNNNKLSYEVHGDGLFDFIFMLKYPNDEISIEHISKWLMLLIQHGCQPELEMRSRCRDLLKFKLIPNKPNVAISIFYYVIHELFDSDYAHSPYIQRINYVLNSLTSQRMKNLTISYFKKAYPDSMFMRFFKFEPDSLKYLARSSFVCGMLSNRLYDINNFNVPSELIQYVIHLK